MPAISRLRRGAATAAGAAALTILLAPAAWANWSSHITDATVGFESRRWWDGSYSQVLFKGCNTPQDKSVDVKLYRAVSSAPDPGYDQKTFTACFNGGTSNGEWNNLPLGDYYFAIKKIDGGTSGSLDVADVDQDTLKDDT
jgi:hypothetical protein